MILKRKNGTILTNNASILIEKGTKDKFIFYDGNDKKIKAKSATWDSSNSGITVKNGKIAANKNATELDPSVISVSLNGSSLKVNVYPIEKIKKVGYAKKAGKYANSFKGWMYANKTIDISSPSDLINRTIVCVTKGKSSYSAYARVWQYVVKNHSDKVEYARGGLKAAIDKELPHITRDFSVLNVGDVIIGDGHTLDFMVKNPRTGKPCRATLVGFLDAASRDLVGYDIMITENTQVIASALRNAIIYLGKMPKVVHLDNGRALKGKTFTGDADFSTAGIQGLYAKLGVKTIFSKPYNGRSKIIERFFKELTESFAKLLPSYIGNNIFNQPACTKRNEKFHKQLASDYVPTIMETKVYIDKWLNEVYRQRPCNNNEDFI